MDFSQVTTEFHKLKAQYNAGALSVTDFKARLHDLMLQDEQGRWWMIGYETGQWHVHDGEEWVQSEPPSIAKAPPQVTEVSRPAAPVQPVTPPAAPAKRRWIWIVAGILGVVGVILAIALLWPDEPPKLAGRLWADRDVLGPGECTWLHWEAPGQEKVRLIGPGFDSERPVPGGGEREICLEKTESFALLHLEGQTIAKVEIQVHQ